MDNQFHVKRRINGFEAPLNKEQKMVWTIFIYCFLIYYTFLIPFVLTTLMAFFLISHLLLLLSGLVFFIRVHSIDPGFVKTEHPNVKDTPFAVRRCNYCQIERDENCKHCYWCKKCVTNFDHHCVWINSCVGGRNYRDFILLVIHCIFVLGLQIILTSISVYNVWTCTDTKMKIEQSYLKTQIIYSIVIISTNIIPFITWFLLSYLLSFHTYIYFRGISTYFYILEQRDKKEQKRLDTELKIIKDRENSEIIRQKEQIKKREQKELLEEREHRKKRDKKKKEKEKRKYNTLQLQLSENDKSEQDIIMLPPTKTTSDSPNISETMESNNTNSDPCQKFGLISLNNLSNLGMSVADTPLKEKNINQNLESV